MEKFEIPAFDEPLVNYLTRWRVIQTPWFSVYLHKMERPDSRPTLHDHPWSFFSFVLWGGYSEVRLNPHTMETYDHIVNRFNHVRQNEAHYITELHKPTCWTLLLVGPRVRTWGYWEPVTTVPVNRIGQGMGTAPLPYEEWSWHWTEFSKHRHSRSFAKAQQARKAAMS